MFTFIKHIYIGHEVFIYDSTQFTEFYLGIKP